MKLSKETFVFAISSIQKHREIMDQADILFKPYGDFAPRLDSGELHLQALLRVLKEVMCDPEDYIEWWLYDGGDHRVYIHQEGKETELNLQTAEDLYDFLNEYYVQCET